MHSKHRTLECAILNILWNFEKNNVYTNSVKEVYEALIQIDSSRAYTTIKTVMDRLHQKGILLRFKQKNKFFYRTAYSKKDMLLKDITKLANLYFEGNLDSLALAIAGYIQEEKISEFTNDMLIEAK